MVLAIDGIPGYLGFAQLYRLSGGIRAGRMRPHKGMLIEADPIPLCI